MKIHSYLTPKAKLQKSDIDRKGIYAVEFIPKGDIVSIWGGSILSSQDLAEIKEKCFREVENYAIYVADGFFLVTSTDGTLEDKDFFNHSCRPNTGMRGQIVLVAIRDITPGEEITYDYSMTDAGSGSSFSCCCGSPDCRKTVTERDWMRPELQQNYTDYFSTYVQDKINALNKKQG